MPFKATTDINGRVLIDHVYRRVCAVGRLDGVVVSTSVESPEVIGWCKVNEVQHYVGSEEDLLSRHLNAAILFKADAILRITADCLFHDPAMLEQMIGVFLETKGADALINWHRGARSASEGLDAAIVTRRCMAMLDLDKNCPREDWLTFLDYSSRYRVAGLAYPNRVGHELHLSIDTPEDLEMARKMLEILGNDEWGYGKTLEAYEEVTSEV